MSKGELYKLKGLLLILLGMLLVGAGIGLTIAWIIFCFGTVIIGILILLFCAPVFLLPYSVVANPGWKLINNGVLVYKRIIL